MAENEKNVFIENFNNQINEAIEKDKTMFGDKIYYQGALSNLINEKCIEEWCFDENGEFDNSFINKLCETIDNNSSLYDKQKEDLKKYFKFQAYSKAFDYITGKTKQDIKELEKLTNATNSEEIDKQIEDKNTILFKFYDFNEFNKEEDKLLFLVSGLRAMSMANEKYKEEYAKIIGENAKNTNFVDIFSKSLQDIERYSGTIVNATGLLANMINSYVQNNKIEIAEKIINSIRNINIKAYGQNKNILNEVIAQTISSVIKNKNFKNLQNIINIAYKDEKTKKEFLLNNFNEEFNSIFGSNTEERKKDLIKSYVELIYNVYLNMDERNKFLEDFSTQLTKKYKDNSQEYQNIIDEKSKELEKQFCDKLINNENIVVDDITITNIDELKLKNFAFIINENGKTEKKLFGGKHTILDVELKTENMESKGKFSIEIPNIKNPKLEDIKIYHYSRSEEDKPGIRTEIEFGNDNDTETKFKKMIVDVICKGRGLEIEEGKNYDEKLNMAINAIKTKQVAVKNIDNNVNMSGTFGNSSIVISSSWKQKEKERPKVDDFGLSKSGGN